MHSSNCRNSSFLGPLGVTGVKRNRTGPEVRFWDIMRGDGLVAIKDVIARPVARLWARFGIPDCR